MYEASAVGIKAFNNRTCVVAVKFLNASSSAEDQIQFLQEAIRTSTLVHPHIVQVLAVCFNTQPSFIVLEHMALGDLKALLVASMQSGSLFPMNELMRMSIDLASALAYLASVKFVHRDIAARNVLVGKGAVVKFGDFGSYALK